MNDSCINNMSTCARLNFMVRADELMHELPCPCAAAGTVAIGIISALLAALCAVLRGRARQQRQRAAGVPGSTSDPWEKVKQVLWGLALFPIITIPVALIIGIGYGLSSI